MNKSEREQQRHMFNALESLGFTSDETEALRRISMTLHRWHEFECGNGNEYGSWAIERVDEGDGKPFIVHHHYRHGQGKDTVSRTPVAGREKGALKRMAQIIAARNARMVMAELVAHPTEDGTAIGLRCKPRKVSAYIQGNPRGAALYILRPGDVPEGKDAGAYYSRGICVY